MNGYKQSILLVCLFLSSVVGFGQDINWINIRELEEAQAMDPRKVFIDVYTDWCGWCKKMDKDTFTNPELANYLNEKYHCVKLDGEDKEIIKFMGRNFSYIKSGRRGYNELPHELLKGRMSYPTVVVLDEEYGILQEFRGYRVAKDLMPIVRFFGEDEFKEKKWTEYINGSKSEK